MRVEQFLRNSAQRFPEKVAIVADGKRTTYQEMSRQVDAFAAALVADGFLPGERCVVFADNRLETAIAIFGILRAGGVFSVINPTTKAKKLAYVLNNCQAVTLVSQASIVAAADAAVADAPTVRRHVVVDLATSPTVRQADWSAFLTSAPSPLPAPVRGIDIDLAMLVYTSGSTGNPKGVTMTHQNVVHAASSITEYLESRADDVVLSVLPLAFDYGLYQLLMCVKMGATLVLERSFAFPRAILPKLVEEKVTGFPLVPTMAALIVQLGKFDPEWAKTVRYLTNTAAALPPAHIAKLQELFPTSRVFSMYGMTESKRCTYLPPEELSRRPTSVGIAIPNTEVWLVDANDRRLPDGSTGELVVRGGHVMKGYWANPEATAKALRPGPFPWEMVLYTGDLFRSDEEGFLYFVGRKDDIIKTRGEKVSPKEVENALYALPGIREAAVIGIPDEIVGASLRAVVALAEGVTLDAQQIIAHCRASLEDFMVPRAIEFRDELPKTSTGKIRRSALQAEALGQALPGDEE